MIDWDNLTKTELYAKTVEQTKETLAQLTDGQRIHTTELIERMYPKANAIYAKQEYIRGIMFKTLALYATTTLKSYCTRGEVIGEFMGKPKRPWLWHAHKFMKVCHECGQEYFEK